MDKFPNVRYQPPPAAPPDALRETLDGIISDIERVADGRMWRLLNGELVWRGQTPDGNEIETEAPRALLASALSAARALRALAVSRRAGEG